jgi:hypothetical protein
VDDNQRLAQIIDDLSRRIAALETAPRASNTSVRNGLFQILDDSGNPVVELGKRPTGEVGLFVYAAGADPVVELGQRLGGDVGLFIYSSDGRPMFEVDNLGGQSTPIIPATWLGNPGEGTDANGRKTTTSATYSDMWRLYKMFAFGAQFGFNFNLSIPGGTTVDVQVTAVEVGGGSPVPIWSSTGLGSGTTQVLSVATIPSSATISGTDSPLGRYFNLNFQMRRTAGAGTPACAPIEQSRIYP